MRWHVGRALAFLVIVSLATTACSTVEPGLTVYSGRSESLIGSLIERFEDATGIRVAVRYGDSAALAAQILEEGDRSPADVFFAQDAGALGALEAAGRLRILGQDRLARVPERFRSATGAWVGTSGRVRVIAFNPDLVARSDVPDSIFDLTDPRWRGSVGWAPSNGSFQAAITALRVLRGEAAARRWLEDMIAADVVAYPNNDAIAEAVSSGEITLGLVNHYYPFEVRAEDPSASVESHFLAPGDPGGLINVAGAAILDSSGRVDEAARFIDFLLSDEGQRFFVRQTFEYPLAGDAAPAATLPSLDSLDAPALDLSVLSDLEATLELLGDVGLLS